MEKVLKGLYLPQTDEGYEKLAFLICDNFGIEITAAELRSLSDTMPQPPLLVAMNEKWPWRFATDEAVADFYQEIRNVARKSGYSVQPDESRHPFRCS